MCVHKGSQLTCCARVTCSRLWFACVHKGDGMATGKGHGEMETGKGKGGGGEKGKRWDGETQGGEGELERGQRLVG